jgi:hypothetical protein
MPTSPEMDALKAKITTLDTVIASAIAAFQGLAGMIATVAGDKDATLALSADVDEQAASLATAIPQNTPVTPQMATAKKPN